MDEYESRAPPFPGDKIAIYQNKNNKNIKLRIY